jgi:hypothetical protein
MARRRPGVRAYLRVLKIRSAAATFHGEFSRVAASYVGGGGYCATSGNRCFGHPIQPLANNKGVRSFILSGAPIISMI